MQDHDFHVVHKDDALICSGMQVLEHLFPCNATPTMSKGELQAAFECDFDKNPTRLYRSIEKKEWSEVLDFMIEGTWTHNGYSTLLFPEKDPMSPRKQASMWVTRFEIDGRVQWSLIPLHAAMIYGAPYPIVKKLLELYPEGIRCTDELGMLPLHLAIKHSSNANVLRILLESFPEGMFAKDSMGRGPFQVKRDERTKILTLVSKYTTQRIQTEFTQIKDQQLQEVYHDLMIQKELNEGLEAELKINNELMQNTKRHRGIVEAPTRSRSRVHTPSSSNGLFYPPSEGPDVFISDSRMWNYDDERQPHSMSEIHRLDRELRAEKNRLEEKNRLNRALRDEKRQIESELRDTQTQMKKMTKRQLQDDLRFSRERIAVLKQKQAEGPGEQNNYSYQLRKLGNGEIPSTAQGNEAAGLDERISHSQGTVSRLQQSRSRVARLKQEAQELKRRNSGYRYTTRTSSSSSSRLSDSRDGDETSATSTSIDGRSIDEMRGSLHKMMKQELKKKEERIRTRLQNIRQAREYS